MGGYHYSLYMQLLQNCTNKLLQEGFVQLTFYPNMFVFFKNHASDTQSLVSLFLLKLQPHFLTLPAEV